MSNVPDRPSGARRLIAVAASHPIITAGFTALAGLVLGWLVGSWSTCSAANQGCTIDVAALEAAGTWVGAIGTILAVLAAVVTIKSGEQSRLDMLAAHARDEAAQVARFRAAAKAVRLRAWIEEYHHDVPSLITFKVENTSPLPITAARPIYNHPVLGRFVLTASGGVAPGATYEVRLRLPDPIETPEDIAETSELTFEIEGSLWRRHGPFGVERL